MNTSTLLTAALLIASAPNSLADVLTVDPTGTADYTDIQPAVTAAADGDIILVKAGTYSRFAITHKGVQVLADPGAAVIVAGGVLIEDTLTHHTVVLAGLQCRGNIHAPVNGYRHAVELRVTRGSVRIESCELTGSTGGLIEEALGGEAVRASYALDLALVNTIAIGGEGGATYAGQGEQNRGGHALAADNSCVALYDVDLSGGKGGFGDQFFCDVGGDGGDGAFLTSSLLFASGSSFLAGDGDDGVYGGDGGNGLHLDATLGPTAAHVLDNTYAGGSGFMGFFSNGTNGQATLLVGPVVWNALAGDARSFRSPTPVSELAPMQLEFTGDPGEDVYLLVSLAANDQLVLSLFGTLVVQLPLAQGRRFLGVIPASGTLVVNAPAPSLPPAALSSSYFIQSLFQAPAGGARLGGFSTLTVLDSSLAP